jgi:hypothetical protein
VRISTRTAPRGEDPDEVTDGGDIELAVRPAVDDEHLRPTGAIDVADRPERLTSRRRDRRPDHLVPEVGSTRQRLLRACHDLEVGAHQWLGRRPVGDLLEAEPPARPVGDGRRPGDRQRLVTALAVEHGANGVALPRVVGEDLDAHGTAKPVQAPDQRDDEAITGGRCRGVGHER